MKTRTLLLALLSLLPLWTLTAAAAMDDKEHVHKMRVGKKGEISIAQPTKAGDTMLQPGRYVIQHRDSGGDHFVRFLALKENRTTSGKQSITYIEKENAGEIRCRIEPAPQRVKETVVYTVTEDGFTRIIKVAIKGEDVMHVF
jgi:hypothetical protein